MGTFKNIAWMPVYGSCKNGYHYPECWDKKLFATEEECRKWIVDNTNNFSTEELKGNICPQEVLMTCVTDI